MDFGASDVVVTDDDAKSFPAPFVSIPMVAGSVVITYNLPGSPELKLTSDIVADIFLGKIKKWNDARIVALNPVVKLPNTAMTVVHRSDGSGTTAVFSDYLAKVSDEWKTKVGVGTVPELARGRGRQGEPRRRGPGEAASRRRGVRGAHLRPAEQHALCAAEEQERQLHQGVARLDQRGCEMLPFPPT